MILIPGKINHLKLLSSEDDETEISQKLLLTEFNKVCFNFEISLERIKIQKQYQAKEILLSSEDNNNIRKIKSCAT